MCRWSFSNSRCCPGARSPRISASGSNLPECAAPEKDARASAEQLDLVGLSEWGDRQVRELSGGMQQRVGLARAFATGAPILLMDEPFSALDPLIRTRLQDELMQFQARLKKTILSSVSGGGQQPDSTRLALGGGGGGGALEGHAAGDRQGNGEGGRDETGKPQGKDEYGADLTVSATARRNTPLADILDPWPARAARYPVEYRAACGNHHIVATIHCK